MIRIVTFLLLLLMVNCAPSKEEKAARLYQTQCSSCHALPKIQDLPKHLWKEAVLPEMAARMGIKDSTYNPFSKFAFREQEAMMKTGIYNVKPSISSQDWKLLKEYIISLAPSKLDEIPQRKLNFDLSQFKSTPINLDSIEGSSITFLDAKSTEGTIVTGGITGKIIEYDYKTNQTTLQDNFHNSITSYSKKDSAAFVTMVGNLNPSELSSGKIYRVTNKRIEELATNLHRPVHTSIIDLDNNDSNEYLVSEFGNLTGALSLWTKDASLIYTKKVLLGQPGVVRTVVKDMNHDSRDDIIVLSSQGNEGVNILYQNENLNFQVEQVIRFSPLFGSSWFELIDYNNDGFEDIITVHGDNADNTFIKKPYHGLRIHINNGNNQFEEKYFYPLYGASRLVADDFDSDGDIDFGVISSFPDYEKSPEFSFVYLENENSKNFEFKTYCLENASIGRWLLMDSGDIDNDGDQDIVLSSFTYYFTPVPENLFKEWSASNVDLLILENQLK